MSVFLYNMSLNVPVTKMDVANIATVWSPNIIITPDTIQSAPDIVQASRKETLFTMCCINCLGDPPEII